MNIYLFVIEDDYDHSTYKVEGYNRYDALMNYMRERFPTTLEDYQMETLELVPFEIAIQLANEWTASQVAAIYCLNAYDQWEASWWKPPVIKGKEQ